MTPAREAESQARRATLRNFRDGLIGIALFFAAGAMVYDAPPATRKESTMSIASPSLAPAAKPALSRWHPHTDEPTGTTRAIILLQPPGAEPITLPELYVWDTQEGYWISASSHLKIRHKEFLWAELYPMLEQRLQAWQRDEEAIAELLGLVGIKVDADAVTYWLDDQVKRAEDWAAAAHLQASDNNIKVPPMPMFLKPYEVQS